MTMNLKKPLHGPTRRARAKRPPLLCGAPGDASRVRVTFPSASGLIRQLLGYNHCFALHSPGGEECLNIIAQAQRSIADRSPLENYLKRVRIFKAVSALGPDPPQAITPLLGVVYGKSSAPNTNSATPATSLPRRQKLATLDRRTQIETRIQSSVISGALFEVLEVGALNRPRCSIYTINFTSSSSNTELDKRRELESSLPIGPHLPPAARRPRRPGLRGPYRAYAVPSVHGAVGVDAGEASSARPIELPIKITAWYLRAEDVLSGVSRSRSININFALGPPVVKLEYGRRVFN
ncbi:hypothetical protein EVAR_23020_1 [Eumeta japonica]|uniref:Uncharacterized protein n=1 Tax=Eumeta variegata TaxID=151549 RepID=A0A4C1UQ51_EUMVA|nr:hypothetical protein EVAR_23020_1 [Eumeta japonica]